MKLFTRAIFMMMISGCSTATTNSRSMQQSTTSLLSSITKLTASNRGSYHYFGDDHAVCISDDNRIVVGAYGFDSGTGVVYVFGDPNNPLSGRDYTELAILLPSVSSTQEAWFGKSVAIDGNILVVGASLALLASSSSSSSSSGAAVVYQIIDDGEPYDSERSMAVSELAILTASNGMADDWFGVSVAIRGNYVLVGANGVDDGVGSAYLFENPTSQDPNTSEWTQWIQFQPNDLTPGDSFGISVALDDEIAVVGTNGATANAAYVFAPDKSTAWTQIAKLNGSAYSYFGNSVAVAGNWIVVGAEGDYTHGNKNGGAVYVFTNLSWTSWTQIAQLVATDGAANDHFGKSVSISKDGSTIVVGAYSKDLSSIVTKSGAAYLFQKSDSTTTLEWTQVGKFVASDQDSNDWLGSSIAMMDNGIVVVGVPGDDSASGSVYVLDGKPLPATTEELAKGKSGVVIGATLGVAVAICVVVLGFFKYRLKKRAALLSPMENNTSASFMEEDEAPIVADVVIVQSPSPTQPIGNGTMVADAIVEPASALATPVATPPDIVQIDSSNTRNLPRMEQPQYKDQARAVLHEPSLVTTLSPPRGDYHQQQEELQNYQEGQPSPEQQKQRHPDPPTTVPL